MNIIGRGLGFWELVNGNLLSVVSGVPPPL